MAIPWDGNTNPAAMAMGIPRDGNTNLAAMAMEIPKEFRAKGIKIVTP
jgi:hypothetical protein